MDESAAESALEEIPDDDLLATEGVVDVDERAEATQDAVPVDYFGTDFDVHGLVRRLNDGDILIPSFDPPADEGVELAGFQRRFVWRKYQMDRFVESLLLGYPVPGIFLVQQPDRKLLVLDGQQRLRTLQAFYRGRIGTERVFKLENVSKSFQGLIYDDLGPEDRRLLDNTFIRATIVKYDPDRQGAEAVYQLFERLNTGGTNLYPQEIRVALYNGALVEMLRKLNANYDWRALYGNVSERLKDQELILRFIAFYTEASTYERPLKTFLNEFLRKHRQLEELDEKELSETFSATCSAIRQNLGERAFRRSGQLNAALVDSLLVGIARRLTDRGEIKSQAAADAAYAGLIADEQFQNSIARATADEERVTTRLGKATAAFAAVL